jgi:hypothetical protein
MMQPGFITLGHLFLRINPHTPNMPYVITSQWLFLFIEVTTLNRKQGLSFGDDLFGKMFSEDYRRSNQACQRGISAVFSISFQL